MNTTNILANYRIYDLTGGGATEDIHAESLEDAIEQGRQWIEDCDWSSKDGLYRTMTLQARVREIVYRPQLADLSGDEGSRVDDLLALECAPESIRGMSYDESMSREQMALLADYLESPDDSVSEEDQEMDAGIARQIRAALEMDDEIDEDATWEGFGYSCNGKYSDELPECEAGAEHPAADEQGHVWVGVAKAGMASFTTHSLGGTCYRSKYVCKCCGKYKVETDKGSQCHESEAREVIEIEDRDEASEAWMKEANEEDGWLPEWLAEFLDCSQTTRYTEEEAKEWVEAQDDSDDLDTENLEHVFAAIFGRRPDDQAHIEGLWGHVCAGARA